MARTSASDAATRVLYRYWVEDNGELPLPIDPIAIARDLQIEVFDAHLDEGMSGMIIKERREPATIFLSASNSNVRRRFSCAHEIGHYVDHAGRDLDDDGEGDDPFAFIDEDDEFQYDRENVRSSSGLYADEIFANQFAAELLMPEFAVRWADDQGYTAAEMAAMFDVSTAAMEYRLRNLRIKPD